MASFREKLPDARRIRSYLFRLPLATRGLLLVITGLYIAHWFVPGLEQWGALIPNEINIATCERYTVQKWSTKANLAFSTSAQHVSPPPRLLPPLHTQHSISCPAPRTLRIRAWNDHDGRTLRGTFWPSAWRTLYTHRTIRPLPQQRSDRKLSLGHPATMQ